jgi:hypothetical protein
VSNNLPANFERFPASDKVLDEFGGIRVGVSGSGVEVGTTDFELDPMACVHLGEEMSFLQKKLELNLYPLGEAGNGHGYLMVDEHGGVYILFDGIQKVAHSFDDAVERLLLGRKSVQTAVAFSFASRRAGE